MDRELGLEVGGGGDPIQGPQDELIVCWALVI